MKISHLFSLTAGLLLWTGVALAQQSETNLTFSVNQIIPDANATGLTLSQNISISPGGITGVKVALDITGGFNGDLYGYLSGPNGGFAVLLNRVGVINNASAFGYSDAGFNLVLSDSAANGDIHLYQTVTNTLGGQLTGLWQPDDRNINPMSLPAAFLSASRSANLSSFNGNNANGTWTLFLADLSSGGQSTLVSWGLDISVPEPQSLALLGLAALFLSRRLRRRRA